MSSIKKNFTLNFIYQLLSLGTTLITIPYIARILGAKLSGTYSYYFSIANYFYLFAMLGINNYGNRSIAYVRDNKEELSIVFSEIYIVQLCMSILSLCFYFIYAFMLSDNFALAIIMALYVAASIFDINWFFFGMEKFTITVTRNIIIRITLTAGVFLLVKTESDIYIYTLLMTFSELVSNIAIVPIVHKYVCFHITSYRNSSKHFKQLLVLFIPTLAISLYNVMDKIMLGWICAKEDVGYYDYSEKMMAIPYAFINTISVVMLPRMSNISKTKSFDDVKRYIANSMNAVCFFSVGMTFGIVGVAPDLIPIFLGDRYLPCINLVYVLAPIIVIKSWAAVIRTQYLIPYSRDRIYVISVILGAIVNALFNSILIPSFGAMGAVIATVFAEMMVMGYQTVKVRKILDITHYFYHNAIYLLFGIAMYFVIRGYSRCFYGHLTTIFVGTLFGGAVYFVLSLPTLKQLDMNRFNT